MNKKQRDELLSRPVPKTKEEREQTEEIILEDFCKVCSATDCTGKVPCIKAPRKSLEENQR